MIGRHLTLDLAARDAQAAEDIASYLYERFGDRHFTSDTRDHGPVPHRPREEASQ